MMKSQIYNFPTLHLVFILFLLITISHAVDVYISAVDDRIYTIGRSFVQDQQYIAFNWPCFQISFKVQGQGEVIIDLIDDWNRYMVVYQGNPKNNYSFKCHRNINRYSIANFTQQGEYNITIHKITENHYGPFGSRKNTTFRGIILRDHLNLMNNDFSKKRKIEIFGDSNSNGYGIDTHGTSLKCIWEARQYQNCFQGYTSQLGYLLNSETHVEAWSGKGVVKNAIGIFGPPMPTYWTKVTTNSGNNSWAFPASWVPDAVIVWLGANDMNNILLPPSLEFIKEYQQMLTQIVNSYTKFSPNIPKIINLCKDPIKMCNWVRNATESFKNQTYNETYYIQIPRELITKQDYGCIWHYNVAGQTKIAHFLAPLIEEIVYGS